MAISWKSKRNRSPHIPLSILRDAKCYRRPNLCLHAHSGIHLKLKKNRLKLKRRQKKRHKNTQKRRKVFRFQDSKFKTNT